jgi:hypothetical protein
MREHGRSSRRARRSVTVARAPRGHTHMHRLTEPDGSSKRAPRSRRGVTRTTRLRAQARGASEIERNVAVTRPRVVRISAALTRGPVRRPSPVAPAGSADRADQQRWEEPSAYAASSCRSVLALVATGEACPVPRQCVAIRASRFGRASCRLTHPDGHAHDEVAALARKYPKGLIRC